MIPLRRLLALTIVAAVVTAGGSDAAADVDPEVKRRARQLYEEGTRHYEASDWQRAVELYRRSYDVYPAPELLFNVAQAYRQLGNCDSALFFFNRFIELLPEAEEQPAVREVIAEAEIACAEAPAGEAPAPEVAASGPRVAAAAAGDAPVATAEPGVRRTTVAHPAERRWSVDTGVGPSVVILTGDYTAPVQMSIAGGLAYQLYDGSVSVNVGASHAWTSLPWRNTQMQTGRASLHTSAVAAEVVVPVLRRVDLRGSAGAGIALLTGARAASGVFGRPGATLGPSPMPTARVALGLDVAVSSAVNLQVSPAYSHTLTPSSFRGPSIRRLDFLVGVGLRL